MLDPSFGRFDFAVAMDSLIYYDAADIARVLGHLAPRLGTAMLLTVAPRTPLLMAMWRLGKLLPRADRAPAMVPHDPARLAQALRTSGAPGGLTTLGRIHSGFYISTALEYRP
jgi:magnesium-protoporphyrin O-methyltransferase